MQRQGARCRPSGRAANSPSGLRNGTRLPLGEGAELAFVRAHVGVVDVAVDDVGDGVAAHALPQGVRGLAHCLQVTHDFFGSGCNCCQTPAACALRSLSMPMKACCLASLLRNCQHTYHAPVNMF